MAGACYHALNRGNYRAAIFRDEGARRAFLKCLAETMERTGWRDFAWAIMVNHFHLGIQTVEPNLVSGMHWLESTFATRFNRLRRENGHLFQGRYKALPVEPGPHLAAVCHYIHLNPVRAVVVAVERLAEWPWTSYRWLQHPRERPSWYDPGVALSYPRNLSDTAAGRREYQQYLEWLAGDAAEQRRLGFGGISKGWALGSKEFKEELIEHAWDRGVAMGWGSAEEREAREISWTSELARLKRQLSASEMSDPRKSADWKVALATLMKTSTTVVNPWLARALVMGSPFAVSRLVSECRSGQRATDLLKRLTAKRKA